jgi:hypothetical protein
MRTDRSIALSQWVYARLLNLYPREHRLEYGQDMFQVFTDQCRSTRRNIKSGELMSLWMRTILDLAVSVPREHFASPRTSPGLLEAIPNAPLPWKGVTLVLIPGMIFFIAQIAQIKGLDWFFTAIQQAACYLIVPVLLTWIGTRRFPIWGLVPAGLFWKTLLDYGNRLQAGVAYSGDPLPLRLSLRLANFMEKHVSVTRLIFIVVLSSLLVWLIYLLVRRKLLVRWGWLYLGLFVLIAIVQPVLSFINQLRYFNWTMPSYLQTQSARELIANISYGCLYYSAGFLALILLGGLLARRHGALTVLLLLGYLIPVVLYGRSTDYFGAIVEKPSFLFWVSVAVVAYRLLVTLAAPCWMARSAQEGRQKLAAVLTGFLAVGIWDALNVTLLLSASPLANLKPVEIPFAISDQLLVAAGIVLALNLYRRRILEPSVPVRVVSLAEVGG